MDADELDGNRTLREQWGLHWGHQLSVLAACNAAHFGASPTSYETWGYAGSQDITLDQLEAQHDVGLAGARPRRGWGRVLVGAKESFPEVPMADLVLHILRELIHHPSEVCLLRDLGLHTKAAMNGATR
ncbi:hypothetical protein [Streptomyces sp. ME19-01-6]|uniref:hypothetical protein n=1 Tax=Streptomyces sp. ME19-01-6 TaxID=3028686 RepID=UPI0029B3719C|nr:hypothetical protein [Streptomyces sp. ME19-01-6]MDX3227626.1 hypothetical protein [Streptomyces sp. ME19-01-6]